MKNLYFFCLVALFLLIQGAIPVKKITSGYYASAVQETAEPGSVIITEIMADPTPSVYLPEKEYLEITSRLDLPISLEGWYLQSGNSRYYLPSVQIAGDEYIILCPAGDTQLFSMYGRTAGLKSFPALNNDGKCIALFDKNGRMVHGVDYTPEWYGDVLKSEGGWSLEMIDLSFPFNFNGNWRASVSSKGGTPGKINSVAAKNPDTEFEGISNAFPADSVSVQLTFSEPVKCLEMLTDNITVNDLPVKSLYATDLLRREFILKLSGPITGKMQYILSLPREVTDYAGNTADKSTFNFGMTDEPEPGDVMFNELLFNPLPGDADYIEIVNVSEKILDASGISVSSKNTQNGELSAPVPVSSVKRCLMPGEYYTFTTNRTATISRYFTSRPDRIFKVGRMPSMPDDKGTLVLFNRGLEILDEVSYSESQHNVFIRGKEGISIEKISPAAPSSFAGIWHSASEAVGWGTPGEKNSVTSTSPPSSEPVSLSSARISPDNDGFEDVILIRLNPEGEGNVTNVTIYDESGMLVRRVAVNFYLGSEGELLWDGTADDGSLMPPGIYIILVTMFSDRGRSQSWKMACALLRK